MARVNSADITSGEGGLERFAYKIGDSRSRPSTSVSIPQGTMASSVLTGALKWVATRSGQQLPMIVFEIDVKFSGPQLQQLLVQLKAWGSDSKLAQFIIIVLSIYSTWSNYQHLSL